MRKVLLGTTALVAASVVMAQVATAEVSVSGAQTFFLTFKSGNKDGAKIGSAYQTEDTEYKVNIGLNRIEWASEVVFSGSGVSDAGLNYGGEVQIRANPEKAFVDEGFLYIGGDSWGMIKIGEDDDVVDGLEVNGQTVLVGLGGEWNGTGADLAGNIDDKGRISYMTPSFSGFSAGLSWTPVKSGGDGSASSSENALAAGVRFGQDLGNMNFKVGGGVRIESLTNRSGADISGGAKKDESSGSVFGFTVGVMGGFDAFSAAVGFSSNTATTEKGDTDDEIIDTKINFGVAYNFGAGGVSAAYLMQDRETKGSSAVKSSSNTILIDADYKLAEGLTAMMEAAINSADPDTDKDPTDPNKDPSETVFAVGMKASF